MFGMLSNLSSKRGVQRDNAVIQKIFLLHCYHEPYTTIYVIQKIGLPKGKKRHYLTGSIGWEFAAFHNV